MPLWLYSTLYAVALVATMTAGIWLLLHLTALARTFAGRADIVPSPKPARASRAAVRWALIAFSAGLLLTMGMQVLAMTGAANSLIH